MSPSVNIRAEDHRELLGRIEAINRRLDEMEGGGTVTTGIAVIPILDADPASPIHEQMWNLRTAGPMVGYPMGLLLAITRPVVSSYTYQLSQYDAEAGRTVRVTMS